MNLEPVMCARPGCGLPWTAHLPVRSGSPLHRVAPGCGGFCWVEPGLRPDHPRWAEDDPLPG